MRLKGCGDRDLAPIEGTYYCDALAYDAIRLIEGIVKALGIEEELECLGEKWILTIPKELSVELDGILGSEEWQRKTAKLFSAGAEILKKLHPEGDIACVAGLDLSGETEPWTAHYHFNFYVLPVVRKEGKWKPLKRWFEEDELERARKEWKKVVERVFEVELSEVDVKRGYFKSWAKVRHFVRYLFRHPLEDFWKGWKGYKDDKVIYSYRKGFKAKTVKVPGKEVLKAFLRVKGLPKNFVRIRWFGFLGNNKKGEVLKGLGFEQKEVKDFAREVGWEKIGLYEVLSFGKEAWVFKKVDSAGKGEEVLKVPLSQLCFCPSDTAGRKRCWIPSSGLGNLVKFALRNGAKIISVVELSGSSRPKASQANTCIP